ncbi:MAG: RNA-binding S4 domain-containing protein [Oscillospiraceae bacterium]|jgi:ribosome-associated protein|nr:RNA-binding S4 domain-containing protein [Oscillospiraceae bacterium]
MKRVVGKIKTAVPIGIRTAEIRLDALLKLANAAESGGQAKQVIQDGEVRVNGEICAQRGKKLRAGDVVGFRGERYQIETEDGEEEIST